MRNYNRREFIAGLTGILGATVITSSLAKAVEVGLTYKSSGDNLILTKQQMLLVARISDIIIPVTDTPGAIDAGVPYFIDHMTANWMNKTDSSLLISGIDKVDAEAKAKHGRGFLTLDSNIQIDIVQALDDNLKQEPAYKLLKKLTVIGYYTSKIGMTVELNYDPIPGPYKEIPFHDVGKSWS